MKWFDNWFRKHWMKAWENRHAPQLATVNETVAINNNGICVRSCVRFTIYSASGGFVVEHNVWDKNQDSEGARLTIINHSEDLGAALAHIVTMESLSR